MYLKNCVFSLLQNEICVYGGEGGQAVFYDIGTHKVVYTCNTGTSRYTHSSVNVTV